MKKYQNYIINDLLLNINDPLLPYQILKEKRNLHFGQRKLLLTLLQFINIFWDPIKIPKPKIIYAGSAPGNNISIISELYPEIEFHLYDPSKFYIKPSQSIYIYNIYFTDDIAKKWANRNDVLFISDIRTLEIENEKDPQQYENIIIDNMNMQMRWYNIIKPVYGQLKFRLPWIIDENNSKKFNYLYGYVFKQPWARENSTETRLVPIEKYIDWDTEKYQNQMFYHNRVIRPTLQYYNPISNNFYSTIDGNELLNDWDSTTEAVIIAAYLKKRSGKYVENDVKNISRLITYKLTLNHKIKQNLEQRRTNIK